MNKTQQLLLTAADVVEHVGWTQGQFARSDRGYAVTEDHIEAGKFCAIGALKFASGDFSDNYQLALRPAIEAIKRSGRIADVVHWNDRSIQTAENVANTMRQAAYKLGPL